MSLAKFAKEFGLRTRDGSCSIAIHKYLLDKIAGSERSIRKACGNTTDTSKALRLLVKENRVKRFGSGGHFEEQMITPYMYASGWFITLFSAYLPFPFPVKSWDVLLSEGVQKTLFRVGLALLRHFEDYLLNLPFEKLLQFLLHFLEESLDLDWLFPIVKVVTSKKHNYWEERKLAWRSLL